MATGPVGYPGYTTNIASYSTVGGDIAAPGGDYFAASETVQDAVLGALPDDSAIYEALDPLNTFFPGITTRSGGATYGWINGTSMAAPHVTGVAALVMERHPNLPANAVAATLKRTATPMSCPPNWEPQFEGDERFRCRGGSDGHTSFFGAGMVDAEAATAR
jgi:lantibiotic leader peptide-processing serine protease